VANPRAFGRTDDFTLDLAVQTPDLPELEGILTAMGRDYADEFRSGFIAENPRKLRRIQQYFVAVCGKRTVSAGALQRERILSRHRRKRPGESVFFHHRPGREPRRR
jgi:hypothetical protein